MSRRERCLDNAVPAVFLAEDRGWGGAGWALGCAEPRECAGGGGLGPGAWGPGLGLADVGFVVADAGLRCLSV